MFGQEGAEPPYTAQSTLKSWQEKNHPWLELSDVHKETTENIRVTVIPFYMGFRHVQGLVNTSFTSKVGQHPDPISIPERTSRTTSTGGGTASG